MFSFVLLTKGKKNKKIKIKVNTPFKMGEVTLINGLLLIGSKTIQFDLFVQEDESYLLINEHLFNLAGGEIIKIEISKKAPKIQQYNFQSFLTILLTH